MAMYLETWLIPFYFVKGPRRISIVTFWGFQSAEYSTIDSYCLLCQCAICMLIVIPLHFLAGLHSESYRWSSQLTFDFLIWTIPIYIGLWTMLGALVAGGGWLSLITSPALYVFTIQTVLILKHILAESNVIRSTSLSSLKEKIE